MTDVVAIQRVFVLEAGQDGQIDGIVIVGAGRQRTAKNNVLGRYALDAEGVTEGQLVLGQRAGLVGAQNIDTGQLLDGDQLADDDLLLGEQTRARRHGDRQHGGHRHRDRRHGQHQGKLQGRENLVATKERHNDDHRHQDRRQHDQVIADLEHGLLKMAGGLGRLHQFGRLAEIGMGTGGVDQGADLPLADDRTGKHRISGFVGNRQRFAGQRRLIDLDLVALEQPCVGRDDITEAQADDVAGDQFPGRRRHPFAVADHPGLDRQRGLQSRDGVARLTLFPEPDHRIGDEQQQDDEEIGPMPHDARQDHCRLDHPRDWAPEITEEFQEEIGLLLLNFVGSILRQPFVRFSLGQPLGRGAEPLFHLRHRQGLQIAFGRGFGIRLRDQPLRMCGGRVREWLLRGHCHVLNSFAVWSNVPHRRR